jgi:hypothetical protein
MSHQKQNTPPPVEISSGELTYFTSSLLTLNKIGSYVVKQHAVCQLPKIFKMVILIPLIKKDIIIIFI